MTRDKPANRPPAACRVGLPDNFDPRSFLAFHGRDRESVAEVVDGPTVEKGVIWSGAPATLVIRLDNESADVSLTGNAVAPEAVPALESTARRMLGLDQDSDGLERTHRCHPVLGPLLRSQSGLRVPQSHTPFEAIAWAIIGQQISVQAAIAIRRRFIIAAGRRYRDSLWCFPDPESVLRMDQETLRGAGLTQSKARALHQVADWVRQSPASSPTDRTGPGAVDELRQALLAIPGVGPWTVNYALLRGYGWLDGSLHGDVAVRKGVQRLLGSPETLSPEQVADWLAPFSPWRALVAAHLWAMLSAGGL